MTPKAAERLRERQQAHPPWRHVDRGKQLLNHIRPELLREISERLAAGTLAVGEIGLPSPTAGTERLEDGSFVIEFNSGLMQLIYLVARTLHASSSMTFSDGKISAPMTRERLLRAVAQIFLDWQANKLDLHPDGSMGGVLGITIPRQHAQVAHSLAVNAEVFILAHELGHVIMDGGHGDLYPAPSQWKAAESYADWIAVRVAIAAGWRLNIRMMYAGMLLAVRVFSFLERLGQQFYGPHLSPSERLPVVKQITRDQFSHDIEFTCASTIASAYDELLEGVENVLLGRPHGTEQTIERVRVRLWAIVEERLAQRLPHEVFLQHMKEAVGVADYNTCQEIAGVFREWFAEPRDPSIPDPTGGRLPTMGALMRSALPDFPESARAVFEAALNGPALRLEM